MDTFNPNQMPPMPATEEKKSKGPLIAVIIILALIIVGGLYFLKQRVSQPVYTPPATTETAVSDTVTDSLNAQSSSDDLNSIEADLNSTNIDAVDQGASAIDAQLQ
ncbi:MAG: hypothetical protein AAB446_02390 [Patescibacteria group bacterium]